MAVAQVPAVVGVIVDRHDGEGPEFFRVCDVGFDELGTTGTGANAVSHVPK